jgi:hypothetical protein
MTESARKHNNRTDAIRIAALAQLEHELADGHAQLADQRVQRQAAVRDVKLARGVASDLSWELADLEQRLRDLKEQREGPRDPLIEREIASLSAARAALEERVLGQMLLVDDLVARAASLEQALALAERVWAEREATLLDKREQLRRRVELPDRSAD